MDYAILPAYPSLGIHRHHVDITKLEAEDDPGVVGVSEELQRWVRQLNVSPSAYFLLQCEYLVQ